jgi:phytoene dehydrogenase-like protein
MVNSGLVEPMARELGLGAGFLPNPVSLGIEDGIFPARGEESLGEYSALLKRLYPESAAEVDALAAEIRKVIRDLKVLYGADNPLFSKRPKDIRLIPAVLVWLIKFIRTIYRIGKLNVPMEKLLGGIITNGSLRDVFSQHFFKGTPAFFTLSYFALYNDYLYPRGGVGALTEAIKRKIEELGGAVAKGTEIVKVIPGQRTIEDGQGRRYGYGELIWAADLKALYSMADITGLAPGVQRKVEAERARILKAKGAESVFSLFLAVDEPLESFSRVCTAHLFYTPSRQGLGDTFKGRLKGLLERWGRASKEEAFAWLDDFCELNTFEVSIPGLRDPVLAPAGKADIIISCLMDYELFKRIKEAGWYDEAKARVEERIIDIFSRTIFPFLRDKLLFKFSASPLSLARIAGSSEGSIVGWSFEDEIPVANSMLKMGQSVRTSMPGVLKAGKWAFSPAGGPTAIMTGRLAANAAIKRRARA